MLTRTAGLELGADGIRLANIAPGTVSTPTNTVTGDDLVNLPAFQRSAPVGPMAHATLIADVLVFLACGRVGDLTATTVVGGPMMQGSAG